MTQISSVALILISPLGSALALGSIALVLAQRGIKRPAWVAGTAALVWLWVWSTPLASVWLLGDIESRYPPLALQAVPSAQAIVVLGGALSPPSAGRQYPDLSGGSDRVWHAARLYHAGKAPLVVMSGGSDPAFSLVSEAQAMRDFIQDLGVPAAAVVLEPDSRNTRENARFAALLLRQRQISQVLLVTPALHMRRAPPNCDLARPTPSLASLRSRWHSMSTECGRVQWLGRRSTNRCNGAGAIGQPI